MTLVEIELFWGLSSDVQGKRKFIRRKGCCFPGTNPVHPLFHGVNVETRRKCKAFSKVGQEKNLDIFDFIVNLFGF